MKKVNKIIPFNHLYLTGQEKKYINKTINSYAIQGNGLYTKKCNAWIEKKFNCKKSIFTHSCTNALEMSAILLNIKPGDEVIMPSYTFVSTANAFVLRGAIPVFIDISNSTLNISEDLIEMAITKKTKAIVVVHYAGISCDMDKVKEIAAHYKLKIVEDAAQSFNALYKNKQLGTIGDLGAISFHETKNIISGEGGSLLINKARYINRSEIIRDKGTNRSKFLKGEVDKYTWHDIGSSYLPSELTAAFLYAQLENSSKIIKKRLKLWNQYHNKLSDLEKKDRVVRFKVPEYSRHNAHMYYILISSRFDRQSVIKTFYKKNIFPTFHYIPLHSSPAGKKYGRCFGKLTNTNKISKSILRLPLWANMSNGQQNIIIESLFKILS